MYDVNSIHDELQFSLVHMSSVWVMAGSIDYMDNLFPTIKRLECDKMTTVSVYYHTPPSPPPHINSIECRLIIDVD